MAPLFIQMMNHKEIRIEDYRYELPEERIANYPVEDRDLSKLLVYRNNKISQTQFSSLPDLLPANSTLIWNNTKVIPARLEFHKSTGALIEIFLLEPMAPSSYTSIFSQQGACQWKTIIGNQKKWKGEALVRTLENESKTIMLSAEYAVEDEKSQIVLKWTPEHLTFARILELFGKTPIPPYLRRESTEKDRTRYQTVYANFDGSVAAPTAGLHFTQGLIDKLKQKNICFNSVTLHVGSGTFVPVKTETIGDHTMHSETVIIDKSTIITLLNTAPDQLTVVGTTSLRSLESLFWLGQQIIRDPNADPDHLSVEQWEPYKDIPAKDTQQSLTALIEYLDNHNADKIRFNTSLLIVPGYKFRLVNRLITNFHQPSSTLLLLVSALVGDKWREIYDFAMANDFRFLSYGDSSLLEIQSLNNG